MIKLTGHADNVLLVRVVDVAGVTGTDGSESPRTLFKVKVLQTLKGSAAGTVTVSQLGAKIGNDIWVPDDQPLLEPGKTYVLATTGLSGKHTLLAGPVAQQRVTGPDQQARLLAKWREAIAHERRPDAFTNQPG